MKEGVNRSIDIKEYMMSRQISYYHLIAMIIIFSLSACTFSGVVYCPRIDRAGSTGITSDITKMMMEVTINVMTIATNRLPKY